MISEQLQQQIEAYLSGSLSSEAQAQFEAKIEQDKALAAEVNLYRQMDDLLGESDVMEFSDTVESIIKAEKTPQQTPEAIIKKMPTSAPNYRRWLSIAAGIALIALVGTVIYPNLTGVSTDELYADNMEFPTALGGGSTLRSIEEVATATDKLTQITAHWQTANTAYQRKQFTTALQALDQIEIIDPNFEIENRGDYYFKKGLVQLQLNQLQESITSFESVKDGEYVSNAIWKRALALLKVDKKQAKVALQQIIDSEHSETTQAKQILESLN